MIKIWGWDKKPRTMLNISILKMRLLLYEVCRYANGNVGYF